MLGRHHISISIATIIPFLIPILLINNSEILPYALTFLFAVFIGSLTPDADCQGKPSLYYKAPIVYKVMIPLTKFVIWSFHQFHFKERFNMAYEVNQEHRGIMHAPLGIVLSSVLLTLLLTIVLLIFGMFGFLFVLIIFLGLLIGQFLHILEDSMTVSGINWKFPYGDKIIKGKIYTFEKIENKVDIRPMGYQYSLVLISIILFVVLFVFQVALPVWLIYIILILLMPLLWWLFFWTSKTDCPFWYQDKEKVRVFRNQIRRLRK